MNKVVTAIVPAFNEGTRIEKTIQALQAIASINRIYVVDDGSTDDTYEVISKMNNVIAIRQFTNQGKGQALKRGIEETLDFSDVIVFVDGDLGESAKDIANLIVPILSDEADVTIAKFPPAKKKGGFGFVKKLARYGVYFHTGVKLNTTLSGQRAFKKEVLQNIHIDYHGYGVELGMLIDILKQGYRVQEVAVEMYHNETGRNLAGFHHRGRQFVHIAKTLLQKSLR